MTSPMTEERMIACKLEACLRSFSDPIFGELFSEVERLRNAIVISNLQIGINLNRKIDTIARLETEVSRCWDLLPDGGISTLTCSNCERRVNACRSWGSLCHRCRIARLETEVGRLRELVRTAAWMTKITIFPVCPLCRVTRYSREGTHSDDCPVRKLVWDENSKRWELQND